MATTASARGKPGKKTSTPTDTSVTKGRTVATN